MKAYKVLLVDDEKLIRDGLKTLVDWKGLGYEIIGEAANGLEAYEKIDELRPHLVIVDIKMPLMDGLTLIEKVYHRHINTRFIILSGHSEFEYAKKAMSLNISQYILKPIDAKLLIDKLHEEKAMIEKQLMIRYARREKILKDMVTQGYVTGEQWNDVYEIQMPWQNYQVLMANEISREADMDLVFDRLYHGLKPEAFGFMIGQDMIFLLKDKVYGRVTLQLENIIREVEKEAAAKLRVICGGVYKDPGLVHQSYKDAQDIKANLFMYEDKPVLSLYVKKDMTQVTEDFNLEAFVKLMIHASQFKDLEKMNDLMESYLTSQESSGFDEDTIIANYMHLYVKLIQGLGKEEEMSYQDFENLVGQKNLQKLHGFVKLKLLEIADRQEVEAIKNPVRRMKWMIDQEFGKDLKLEDIACELGYNPAYLGKQFKEKEGQSFNVYLDRVRILEGKRLLEDSELKIYEIAEKIGYKSSDYFTLKFRKYEGMSPKEYRNLKKSVHDDEN